MKRKKFRKVLDKRPRLRRKHKSEEEVRQSVPRITNETVAAHREEVIGSARKYIYPLQHSKHRIVLISSGLFILATVVFFSYSVLALYRFESTSTFLYRVTQVIPFPIARASKQFVSYEDYLFELRHYTHYYENQLGTDFSNPQFAPQLADFKRRALEKVVNDAYVKQLAREQGVKVGDQEVNDQIAIVRNQNRLGGNEQVFEDVLKDYWGWSVEDFKRSLHQELLAQKVSATLDTDNTKRADTAFAELGSGVPFDQVAKKYSDDERTKNAGGDFGYAADRTDRNLAAQTTEALFKLKPGETSGIINVGYALEILKNLGNEGDKIRGAHILFTFKDINTYINNLKEKEPARLYLSLPTPDQPSKK